MSEQALSHIRVIDLTQGVAGPYCTKLMTGFGAHVCKIEQPDVGDVAREHGPFVQHRSGVERSVPFLWLNTGKRSVTANLETEEGRDLVRGLVRSADLLIENFAPGVLEGFGLGFKALALINPRLVMVSITNFGQTGPYRDYRAQEITANALSGLMYVTGNPARAPLSSGPAIAQYTAGAHAFIAALLALRRQVVSGYGEHVDISIQESVMDNIEIILAEYLQHGKVAKRKNDQHALVPWEIYDCRDGYAAVIGGPVRNWLKAAAVFEEPRLFEERFRHIAGRIEHRDEFAELLKPWLRRHSKEDVYHAGQARQLAFGYLADLTEALNSSQLQARDFFVEVDHPEIGKHRYCGAPFKLTATPWQTKRAPLLGEHNDTIEEDFSAASPAPNAQVTGRSGGLPLEDVRVLDLSHDWAGPHAARLLADCGAQVIKIEYQRRLDGMRGGVKENRAYDHHPRWLQLNRNKLSVTLDLKKARDVQIFKDLVGVADVLIENSRTGVMERLGLGYEALKTLKPDLIYLSMTAFGHTGPEARYAGYGGAIEALSGMQTLTAYEKHGRPMRIKEMDVTNGIIGTCAVMTALSYKQRTGRGQWIDLSELETATHALIGEHMLELVMNGEQTLPLGNRHPRFAPQGCYQCEGVDKWVALTVCTDEEWERLCGLMGQPELAHDIRFAECSARMKNHDELDHLITEWTRAQTHYSAMHRLQEAGIAAGAVLNAEELCSDPHLKERGFFQKAEDGSGVTFQGMPFRSSETISRIRRRGPKLGEHNQYVFGEMLGHSGDVIALPTEDEIGTAFDIE